MKLKLILIAGLAMTAFCQAQSMSVDELAAQIRQDENQVAIQGEQISARNQIAIDFGKKLADQINAKQVVGQTVTGKEVYLVIYSKAREYEDKGQPNPDFVPLAMDTVKKNILFALSR